MATKANKNVKRKKSTPSKKNKPQGATSARKTNKLAGLNPRLFSKIKQEFHDIDYAKDLPPKLQEYMASFMEESLGARFNHDGKKHIKSKANKKKIYTENNARQRDTYALTRATGRMVDIDPEIAVSIWQERYLDHDFEDSMLKQEEKPELLTKREFKKLLDSGAEIPFEMLAFYMDYYDLE